MSKTYGQQFNEALACKTPEEAAAWLAKEVRRYRDEFGKDAAEAERIIKVNIGYMAGYYDDKTAKQIHRLFGATHPVFGGSDYHITQTPEEAFSKGVQLSKSTPAQSEVRP